MTATHVSTAGRTPQDTVSKVLIWCLLVVTVGCWGTMIWAIYVTYREVAPLPQQFVTASGPI